MLRYLLLFLLFSNFCLCCISCGSDGDKATAKNTISSEKKVLVPHKVKDYISKKFRAWKPINTSDYIKSWWSFYDRSTIPYIVTTDLNDDQLPDYGLLIRKDDSVKALVLIGTKVGFQHWTAHNLSRKIGKGSMYFGLTNEPPGRIDIAFPKIASLNLKSNGINLMEYEVRNCIYYWADGKMQIFHTN